MKREVKEIKAFCDFCNSEARDNCSKCKKDLCEKHYHLVDTNINIFTYLCPNCTREITDGIKEIFSEFGWSK